MQTDVREALAELVEILSHWPDDLGTRLTNAILAGRAALAASPQVEHPVAYLCSITHPDWLEVCERGSPGAFPVYASPTPAQAEPHVTDEMVAAYLQANAAYWKRIDDEPGKLGVWRNRTPAEATKFGLIAALGASAKGAK